ncbi:MAG: sigma-70 family RNA polymerase sigma factor [Oscillospiraceae bacterium]|nr:sigma-70 family RNA polymerase sigma factor [Oscillospiraceae bacterium]
MKNLSEHHNANHDEHDESKTSALICEYMRLVRIKAYKAKKLCNRFDIDADDFVSEGFLGLLSAIRTYDEQKGKFEVYANACISNRIKNLITSGGENGSDGEFDITSLPDKRLTEEIVLEKESFREISAKLHEVLSQLEYSAFSFYLDSYSYSAIAEKLGVSVKTIDNALSRAKSKLRKVYG